MSRLAHQAELLKLSRLLDLSPAELPMLATMPPAAIRQLREQATQAAFADDDAFFKRVVAASRLLPVPVLALVAEHALGPLLAARVAGQMDVKRGVGIAQRLPAAFLAEVCLHLDPHRTRELIRAIDIDLIVDVALHLAELDEHVTMGRFVDIITDEAITAVIAALEDDADLLHTAFLAENKARLDTVVEQLPETRVLSLIRTAASGDDLWPETLGLMQHLSPEVRGRLADLAARQEEDILTSMVRSVQTHDLWGEVLPLLADMGDDARARFANLPALQTPEMLTEVLRVAGRDGVWGELLPLIRLMDDAGRARCAAVAAELDGEQLLQIAEAAADHHCWPEVIDLLQRMDAAPQTDVIALIGLAPNRVAETLVTAVEDAQAWALVNQAWSRMSQSAQARLQSAADAQGLGDRIRPGAGGRSPDRRAAAAQAPSAKNAVAVAPVGSAADPAVITALDAVHHQLRRQTAAVEQLREDLAMAQADQRGLRGTLTALTLVSGIAMVLMVAAIAILIMLRVQGA